MGSLSRGLLEGLGLVKELGPTKWAKLWGSRGLIEGQMGILNGLSWKAPCGGNVGSLFSQHGTFINAAVRR